MEIHELLDRFELLYPDIQELADLRRAYIDQDLNSIFRLSPDTISGTIDDLRKAVTDKDLRSIFKLVDFEDLAKLILDSNMWKIGPLLSRYVDTEFINAFKILHANEVSYDKDCFSRGQLQSKLWLVDELTKCNEDLGTVFLCAGWYGTLAVMLFEQGLKINKIRSFDLDPTCAPIAEVFNKKWVMQDWKFKAATGDIHNINWKSHTYDTLRSNGTICSLTDYPDTIINTSCEHIENFESWFKNIPTGKLIVLQSNNYFEIKEHVNCSASLEDFSNSCPMTVTLYEGELNLNKYKRFMKIGYR